MPRDSEAAKPTAQKICLLAGEASGDNLGAGLMAALCEKTQNHVSFCGIGGAAMQEQGLQSLFPMSDLSVMGIMEVIPRVPLILRRLAQTVAMIENTRPDILVTIDSPDFCFRVAKRLHQRGIYVPKMVHYVAPTVWAWRPERAKKVAALYDGILCLYPFEPPYFEAEKMDAAFVGHPVMNHYQPDNPAGQLMREDLKIPHDATVLGVLFGSRIGEINRMGPVLREALARYTATHKNLHIIAPTFLALKPQVKNLLQQIPCKTYVVTDQTRKWDYFAAMDRALATSGTVGLELAVAGVPHIIGYKVTRLTHMMVKNKITSKYAHLANILLDDLAVPEFIQDQCRPELMATALQNLDAAQQQKALSCVREQLVAANGDNASQLAAQFILDKVNA